jgi:hypothetical protein
MNKWIKWLLILALIGGILAAAVYWYVTREYENTKTVKADFITNVKDFGADFKANDSVANKKYNNKVVEITGEINEIILTDSTAVIKFTDSITNLDIVCDFQPQSVKDIKNLKEGSIVTLKGVCTGLLNVGAKTSPVSNDKKDSTTVNPDEELSMIDGTGADEDEEGSMLEAIKSVSIIRCAIINPNKK